MRVWHRLSLYDIIEQGLVDSDLLQRCARYCLDADIQLYRMPTDTQEYAVLASLLHQHKPDAFLLYDIEYTKKEMSQAEYYTLGVNLAPICGYGNALIWDYFELLAQNDGVRYFGRQIKDYELSRKEWSSRDISYTSLGRFLVSQQLKSVLETSGLTNLAFRPCWCRGGGDPVAWQLKSIEKLPPIAPYNAQFLPYAYFPDLDRQVLWDVGNQPLTLPASFKGILADMNTTSDEFTDMTNHIYIISKRFYDVLQSFKVKRLSCEPVFFLD